MKYTILGFQQDKANNLKLNMNDLLLMRTVKDMYSSASMEYIIEDGDKYMWANQNYLFKQIPIIGSKRTMLRSMDKLVGLDLLHKVLKHDKKGVKGNFSYIKPTVKMDRLQDYEPYDKMAQGLRQNGTRVMTEWHDKDTSIRDTSIRDTKESVEQSSQSDKSDAIPYLEIIEHLNKKTGKSIKHTANGNRRLIRARWNEGYTLDDFKKVIDNKSSEWMGVVFTRDGKSVPAENYLHPATLFIPKNFDRYLNEQATVDSNNSKGNRQSVSDILDEMV